MKQMKQKLRSLFKQWVSCLSYQELSSNPALLSAIEDLEKDFKKRSHR